MATVLQEEAKEEGDEAQSILEAHVSRIWDSSNGQTPSRSPGRHSPKSMSPDRSFRGSRSFAAHPTPNTSASGNALTYPSLPGKGSRRNKGKDKDNMFMFSSSVDSGMCVEERTGYPLDSYTHKHVHHYHHHHHHVPKDKVRHDMNYYVSSPHMSTDTHGVGLLEEPPSASTTARSAKRSSKKNAGDSSSNIDSGVSGLHYNDVHAHTQVPNSHDPNYNK